MTKARENATQGGLVLLTPGSATGGTVGASGGITFSGASSVAIDNVFSASYQNYRVAITITSQSVGGAIAGRFRTSGTTNSSSAYSTQYFSPGSWGTSSNAYSSSVQNSTSLIYFGGYNGGTNDNIAIGDIFNPFASMNTYTTSITLSQTEARVRNSTFSGTNSFDGIIFYNDSGGTITGTIRIYGYKN